MPPPFQFRAAMLSKLAAYANSRHGCALAFVVLVFASGTPLILLACGYFRGPAPAERPAACSRTLC